MGWRHVVVSEGAKLDCQMGYLSVRREETLRIHISEISTLILETTAISLTGALIAELTKAKVKVIFCDEKRNPSCELVPYYGAHDTSAKIREQVAWGDGLKTLVWTSIVTEKIRQQEALLREAGQPDAADLLCRYIDEMLPGDASNREGHAAKVYFNALFGMTFTRSSECSLNAALNYGYSLLLSAFNREIAANGYLTQLGLFHDNMFNFFNLASDLMEPFRPLVDRIAVSCRPEKFEHEEKVQMLKLFQAGVQIAGRKELVDNAVKIYCRSVFDALREGDPSRINFYRYELPIYESDTIL